MKQKTLKLLASLVYVYGALFLTKESLFRIGLVIIGTIVITLCEFIEDNKAIKSNYGKVTSKYFMLLGAIFISITALGIGNILIERLLEYKIANYFFITFIIIFVVSYFLKRKEVKDLLYKLSRSKKKRKKAKNQ